MKKTFFTLFVIICCEDIFAGSTQTISPEIKEQAEHSIQKRSSLFRENKGQWEKNILYKGIYDHGGVSFLSDGLSFMLPEKIAMIDFNHTKIRDTLLNFGQVYGKKENKFNDDIKEPFHYDVYNLYFEGMNKNIKVVGENKQQSYANYLLGTDFTKHITNVREYTTIKYCELYDAIDVVYYEEADGLKNNYIIKPGGDIRKIKLRYEGIVNIQINNKDELELKVGNQIIKEIIPYSYLMINGIKKQIHVEYELHDDKTIGFRVDGEYDKAATLVIDPVIMAWCTFVAGGGTSQSAGQLWDIDLDATGNVYGVGEYHDFTFPTTAGSYDQTFNGGNSDGIIFKLNPTGSGLIFSTYIGGSGNDKVNTIEVNNLGEIFIGGVAGSTNFPITTGAFQAVQPGPAGQYADAFVCKLNPAGSALIYSTFLGGSLGIEYCYDLAIDNLGQAYVTGMTQASDFPTTPGCFDNSFNGASDIYVCKLNANGSGLIYSTFIGGSMNELGQSLAINNSGEVFVTGYTASTNFPIIAGAFQIISTGGDAFVTKLNSTGSGLIYSTFIGGSAADYALDLAINNTDEVFITGYTSSVNFPVTLGAFDISYNGGLNYGDAFVVRLNASGSGLIYSTFLGGGNDDFGQAIVVNSKNEAFVTGAAHENMLGAGVIPDNFPITNCAYDNTGNNTGVFGNSYADIFLCKLNDIGTNLLYSTYVGGSGSDVGEELKITDTCEESIVIGATVSFNYSNAVLFPTTSGAFRQLPGNSLNNQPAVVTLKQDINPSFIFSYSVCGVVNFTNTTDFCGLWKLPDSHIWNFGDGTTSTLFNPSHTYSMGGTYNVKLVFSCPSDSITIPVTINTNGPTLTDNVTIALGESTILNASGGSSYLWAPSTGLNCTTCANPTASPQATTIYCVTVTDGNGCSESVCVTIVVDTICAEIFVPTAFSPNEDASNDLLCIYGTNCVKSLTFTIYNRWGEVVFETTDPKACWDGIHDFTSFTTGDKKINEGIFVYYLNVILNNKKAITKRGNITLVK